MKFVNELDQLFFIIFFVLSLLIVFLLLVFGMFKEVKLELGIFTGKGMFCTIFATIVLIACCCYSSEYVPIFIIVFLVWELYVNAYYSAEIKHNKNINEKLHELKTKMDNEPYGSSLYNTYKSQYDSLINNEKLMKATKIASTLAMLAATHNAISDYNKKELENTRDLLDRNRRAIEELENRSLDNNGLH